MREKIYILLLLGFANTALAIMEPECVVANTGVAGQIDTEGLSQGEVRLVQSPHVKRVEATHTLGDALRVFSEVANGDVATKTPDIEIPQVALALLQRFGHLPGARELIVEAYLNAQFVRADIVAGGNGASATIQSDVAKVIRDYYFGNQRTEISMNFSNFVKSRYKDLVAGEHPQAWRLPLLLPGETILSEGNRATKDPSKGLSTVLRELERKKDPPGYLLVNLKYYIMDALHEAPKTSDVIIDAVLRYGLYKDRDFMTRFLAVVVGKSESSPALARLVTGLAKAEDGTMASSLIAERHRETSAFVGLPEPQQSALLSLLQPSIPSTHSQAVIPQSVGGNSTPTLGTQKSNSNVLFQTADLVASPVRKAWERITGRTGTREKGWDEKVESAWKDISHSVDASKEPLADVKPNPDSRFQTRLEIADSIESKFRLLQEALKYEQKDLSDPNFDFTRNFDNAHAVITRLLWDHGSSPAIITRILAYLGHAPGWQHKGAQKFNAQVAENLVRYYLVHGREQLGFFKKVVEQRINDGLTAIHTIRKGARGRELNESEVEQIRQLNRQINQMIPVAAEVGRRTGDQKAIGLLERLSRHSVRGSEGTWEQAALGLLRIDTPKYAPRLLAHLHELTARGHLPRHRSELVIKLGLHTEQSPKDFEAIVQRVAARPGGEKDLRDLLDALVESQCGEACRPAVFILLEAIAKTENPRLALGDGNSALLYLAGLSNHQNLRKLSRGETAILASLYDHLPALRALRYKSSAPIITNAAARAHKAPLRDGHIAFFQRLLAEATDPFAFARLAEFSRRVGHGDGKEFLKLLEGASPQVKKQAYREFKTFLDNAEGNAELAFALAGVSQLSGDVHIRPYILARIYLTRDPEFKVSMPIKEGGNVATIYTLRKLIERLSKGYEEQPEALRQSELELIAQGAVNSPYVDSKTLRTLAGALPKDSAAAKSLNDRADHLQGLGERNLMKKWYRMAIEAIPRDRFKDKDLAKFVAGTIASIGTLAATLLLSGDDDDVEKGEQLKEGIRSQKKLLEEVVNELALEKQILEERALTPEEIARYRELRKAVLEASN